MNEAIEAGAGIASGALVGRTIEPQHGERSPTSNAEICRNCGAVLVGPHCHLCGQAAHLHRTMGAIGHEIAHGVFHFDAKIWRTLPMLIRRPGELTRRYIDGERARFVSPMAFFLFTVFLMFTVVANLPGWGLGNSDLLKPGVAAKMAETRSALAEEQAKLQSTIDETNASLTKSRADPQPDADRIATLEERLATATRDRDAAAATARALPIPTTFDVEGAPPSSSENWLEQKWRHVQENPKLVLYKIKTSAYKFSWALIPISLPFIWLLFPFRRDVGMYDHAIFATYSLTFMSLLVIALAVLGSFGVPTAALATAAIIVPPFHIYRQLKGAYRLGRAGALWRTFWMLAFAFTAAVIFVLLLVYLGIAD